MSRDRVRMLRAYALNGGAALVALGIACFDYRLGMIAVGGSLAAAALWGMSKDARNTPRT